jgi:hypothetical protein
MMNVAFHIHSTFQAKAAQSFGPEKPSARRKFFDLNLGYNWDRFFLVLFLILIALRIVWLDAVYVGFSGGL